MQATIASQTATNEETIECDERIGGLLKFYRRAA